MTEVSKERRERLLQWVEKRTGIKPIKVSASPILYEVGQRTVAVTSVKFDSRFHENGNNYWFGTNIKAWEARAIIVFGLADDAILAVPSEFLSPNLDLFERRNGSVRFSIRWSSETNKAVVYGPERGYEIDVSEWLGSAAAFGLDPEDSAPETSSAATPPLIGVGYRRADSNLEIKARAPQLGSNALALAELEHRRLQNAFANILTARGFEPKSPTASPVYDVAWFDGQILHVAEVKSTTPANFEHQLRLALGQVLRYAAQLRILHKQPVIAHVVFSANPSADWTALFTELHVEVHVVN
jgi:hypothetical protein